MSELSAEDAKLVTLARASRSRNGAAEGAALRDSDGRTYVATTVALSSLSVSALAAVVAAAVSSGAPGYEAIAVVSDAAALTDADASVVAELGVPVLLADYAGELR